MKERLKELKSKHKIEFQIISFTKNRRKKKQKNVIFIMKLVTNLIWIIFLFLIQREEKHKYKHDVCLENYFTHVPSSS